jgi:hypothetical protein
VQFFFLLILTFCDRAGIFFFKELARSEFHAQELGEEPLRSSTPMSRSWTESGWPQAAAIGCAVFFLLCNFLFDLNWIGSGDSRSETIGTIGTDDEHTVDGKG